MNIITENWLPNFFGSLKLLLEDTKRIII